MSKERGVHNALKAARRWLTQALLVTSALTTASCSFAPPYRRPCVVTPTQWRFGSNKPCCTEEIRWWRLFGDEQLDAYILQALHYNQDIKEAAARVCEFYAKVAIAASDFFPQIDAGFTALRQELSADTNFIPPGFGRINGFFSIFIQAAYEVDLWGRVRNATNQALGALLSQEENRRTVILGVVTGVAASYLFLKQLYSQLKVANETVASRQESYDLQLVRYEEGLTSELTVKQSESELFSSQSTVVQIKTQIAQQEDLMSVLLGTAPQPICPGVILDELEQPPCIPEGLPSDILLNRPDLRAAEWDLYAAGAAIGVARALLFPQISSQGFSVTKAHN